MKLVQKLFRFTRNRSGATAMEYALIGGIICIAIVAGATTLGGATNDTFTNVNAQVWGG
jgi:pilus assembly protein Flp/PilA